MKIIKGYPPNIDAIRARFGAANVATAIFAYGDAVYVPSGHDLPLHLQAHELTHLIQQDGDPVEWWDKYLKDSDFRLSQELEAYRKQYEHLTKFSNRQQRRWWLDRMSRDLSGPMYGNLTSKDEAKEAITS
jgi:hypothetical protein